MRPRKWVMVFGRNVDDVARLRYVLDLRLYHAVAFSGPDEAARAAAEREFAGAVFLAGMCATEAEAAIRAVKRVQPETKALLIYRGTAPEMTWADVTLADAASTAEIVDRVRTLTVGKRGPKKPRPALESGQGAAVAGRSSVGHVVDALAR